MQFFIQGWELIKLVLLARITGSVTVGFKIRDSHRDAEILV